jgi:hypothetical protein
MGAARWSAFEISVSLFRFRRNAGDAPVLFRRMADIGPSGGFRDL